MFESLFEFPPESFAPRNQAERRLVDLPADDSPGIPAGLDTMNPGPGLAAVLSTIDPFSLPGWARVKLIQACQRQLSSTNGGFYTSLTALTEHMIEYDEDCVLGGEAAAYELRAALRLTRRGADTELDLAEELSQRLPAVGAALSAGDIDVRRARVICYGTGHLTDATAREVVDMVLPDAHRLTSGQLHAKIRKLCIEADPEEAKSRYQQALDDRKLVREANTAGTAGLYLTDLPPDRAAEAYEHINNIALSLTGPDDERSMDQIRADVAVDLLTGQMTYRTRSKGTVDICVDLTTLAELDDNPGELAGFGPVIADIARQVTEHQHRAEWRYTITDPETGMVVDNGTTRRRPNAHQTRHVEARNRTCITPGCRMPAVRCDLASPSGEVGDPSDLPTAPPAPPETEFRPEPKFQRLGGAETRPLSETQIRMDIHSDRRRRLPVDLSPWTQIHHQRTPTPVTESGPLTWSA
ncbi:MAG: DUF222 domain-containing protein [Acidimicrobiia bacterium]